MKTQIQQPCAEVQMSLGDCRSIKMETIVSNLVMALVLSITVMLVAFGWILFT
jgi:hypothetical protein